MGFLVPMLIALCAASLTGHVIYDVTETVTEYYDYDYVTDPPTTEDYDNSAMDWVYELLDTPNECDPNPCDNNGICNELDAGGFTCSCPEPYTGRTCQAMKDVCKNVNCGHGDCLRTSVAPFYHCKCQVPFQAPSCRKGSGCNPNPCQNGGSCRKSSKSTTYQCTCPNGFTGKLCQVGPTDCMEEEGESYRGTVSVTVEGNECLYWNSGFIRRFGGNPLNDYLDFDGIGEHNSCRNPDGESRPWCYVKLDGVLDWQYCNIRSCSGAPPTPTIIDPTSVVPTKPDLMDGQFSQCGQPQPGRSSRIFGGRKSIPGAHPWQASLQVRPKGSSEPFRHICGGILIESCWVLTAAHCIEDAMDMQVFLGGVDRTKVDEYSQIIPVERAFPHKEYRKTEFAVYNDVAMLQLKVTDKPYCAKESRFVKTACLPQQPFSNGMECVISGWGRTETLSRGSNQLLTARVLLISDERCKQPHVYGDHLDNSMFCAGRMSGGVDSCQGDSGGPLVCERNGTHYITGVVSWGDGCGEKNKPGVYANVYHFNDWITAHMA